MRPTAPNQAWLIDMTSFQLSNFRPVFLVTVIDCFTRQIVGWTLDQRCRAKEWSAVVREALESRGLIKNRFHGLRHTTGSHLAMNGCTELEIAEILGHKDTTVTRRYTKLTRQHGHTVINRLIFPKQKKDTKKKCPYSVHLRLELGLTPPNST